MSSWSSHRTLKYYAHWYWLTHSTFWNWTVNSGDMLFKTVLIHCESSASDGLLVSCWSVSSSQIRAILCTGHSQPLNGLLTVTPRNLNWELMQPNVISRFVFRLYVFTSSVKWPLTTSKTSMPLYFRKAPGLLSPTSLSHSNISSIIHPFSLLLKILPLRSFFVGKSFLVRSTLASISSHQPDIKTSHLF